MPKSNRNAQIIIKLDHTVLSLTLCCPFLVSIQPPLGSCMRRSCRSFWTSLQLNPKLPQTWRLSPRQTATRMATWILTSTATRKTVSSWSSFSSFLKQMRTHNMPVCPETRSPGQNTDCFVNLLLATGLKLELITDAAIIYCCSLYVRL